MTDMVTEEKAKVDLLKIPLDPIHGGLRIAVFGSFFGAGTLGFIGSLLLLPNAGAIPFVVAALAAVGTSGGMERLLKDRWSSGREFVADSERIALTRNSKIETVIDPTQQVNVLTWKFEVKKDGPRAKKGFQLLGFGLKQDDIYLVVYTTVSPDDMEKLAIANSFTTLQKRNAEQTSSASLTSRGSVRQAGEQKRLYDAEIARQLVGGDMLFDDFVAMIEFLQTIYPQWMIQ